MACPAWFLAEKGTYSAERFLADLAVSAFYADVCYWYEDGKHFDKDDEFSLVTVNLYIEYQKPGDRIVVYVESEKRVMQNTFEPEQPVRGLVPGVEYCRFGRIGNIQGSERLLYNLVYEYLKRRPEHRFWVEGTGRAIGWEDMQRVRERPYVPDWWKEATGE
ncbi:MAG: hypothetical protein BLM47_11815 [Candidatus Reconcilbacillus cellulovorans]|uniref:Uncharacterized protein n=1 Tax=Candidatus Reconcilbacillus cellulovorans TaxID=1906605 RepID=A0A2A6DXY1_9BACL|nr:MAG: hypothetical protein BLM47_11815 [Candidatus Reconcilbacillus cellulovorans]